MNNNLELYKTFYTVASCGNISLASEKLFISQPAVSKSIKKLETLMGIALFSRNSRGVKLTEEGLVFYKYIERALNEINVGEKVIDKLKNKETGVIKLGVSTTLCKHFLIPKLKKFIKEYPHIQVKIINKTPFETLKILENGELDLVIISEPPEKDFYNFIELSEIQDIFVAEKNYLQSLSIKNYNDIFSSATFMLMESGNISRGYIDKYFQNNHIQIKPEIEVSNMDLLIEFAKIGLGVTAVIKNFIRNELEEGKLVEIPIMPPIPKRHIGVVYHKNIPLSVAAETFLKYLF
jgi:DNA-binding transcriptional LysR family regulator